MHQQHKAQMRVFFDAAEMQAKGTPPRELKKIIKDRYKAGYYKAPKRAGISYMLSPVLRTYWDPEKNDSVVTANIPHVMYYAPHVSNEDIGGKLGNQYPFVIMSGPHEYIVQLLGQTERPAIIKSTKICLQDSAKSNKCGVCQKRKVNKPAHTRTTALQLYSDYQRAVMA